MKNIIIFDVHSYYSCACVANIYENGVNSIILTFESDSYIEPKFEIMLPTGDSALCDLTVLNDVAVGEFNWHEIFGVDNPPAYCKIRYVDGDKLGTWFEWKLSTTTVPDGMIEAGFRTLRVYKTSSTSFEIKFVASELIPIGTANPDDFDVSDDGVLSLKENTEKLDRLEAAKNTDNKVSEIKFVYVYEKDDGTLETNEDGTTKETTLTYNCTYNSDGDLISFGDIKIDWSVGNG